MVGYVLYKVSSPALSQRNDMVYFSDGRYLYGFYMYYISTRILLYLINNKYTVYVNEIRRINSKELSMKICFDEPFYSCFIVFLRRISYPLLYEVYCEDRESIKKTLLGLLDYIVDEMIWCGKIHTCTEIGEAVDIISFATGTAPEKVYSMIGVSSPKVYSLNK